nr:4'-phosphopantetheinyl transferase superfamily protein [Rhodospirillum rubrum]
MVGVDAEVLGERGAADPALAALVCTPREQGILVSLAAVPTRWWEVFLGMWVRKEAVAKAEGLGLSMSLTTLETVPEGEDGSSGSWCLWSPRPASLHRVAVAARTTGGPRPPFLHTVKTWRDLLDDLV